MSKRNSSRTGIGSIPGACTCKVDLVVDGCLECGTCRLVCDAKNVDWNYPRGGFGILFKFG